MNQKAFFLDLDGTLLNDKKEVTPENRAAISEALKQGHKVIITTGRPLVSAIQQAEVLDLTSPGCYLISYNGGILYDTGNRQILFQKTIPIDLVKKVFAEANRRNLHIQTYNDTSVLVEPRCADDSVERYCNIIHMNYEIIDDINQLSQEPVKMLLIDFENREYLENFRTWLTSWSGNVLDSFFSCKEYVEIVPKGLNKGNALLQMAELLNIPYENTIAVGDAENDYPMIKTAHTGVCMCNGCDALKEIADDITTRDNNHDGIAEVIKKYT